MEKQLKDTVQIADHVVAFITETAAMDTEGVAGMSGGVRGGLTKKVTGKNKSKGISVRMNDTEASFELRVIMKYGEKIHEITRDLQRNVKNAVESMTGLTVTEVAVKVEGVEMSA